MKPICVPFFSELNYFQRETSGHFHDRRPYSNLPPCVVFCRRAKVHIHAQLLPEPHAQVIVPQEWFGGITLQQGDKVCTCVSQNSTTYSTL